MMGKTSQFSRSTVAEIFRSTFRSISGVFPRQSIHFVSQLKSWFAEKGLLCCSVGVGGARVGDVISEGQEEQSLSASSGVAPDVVLNFVTEILLVSQMMFCCVDVQRVVKVQQIRKQGVQSPHHVLECPGGGPSCPIDGVFSKQTETDLSALRDVWMPYSGQTANFRRHHVVSFRDVDLKLETTALVITLVWRHSKVKVMQLVFIREVGFTGTGQVGLEVSDFFS